MGIKPFDIRNIGRTGLINPEQLGYQDSLDIKNSLGIDLTERTDADRGREKNTLKKEETSL